MMPLAGLRAGCTALIVLVSTACTPPRPSGAEPTEVRTVRLWRADMREVSGITIDWRCAGIDAAWSQATLRWRVRSGSQTAALPQRPDAGASLLVSRPQVSAVAARSSPAGRYGLDRPQMLLSVRLTGNRLLQASIGDRLPDGTGYYLRVPGKDPVYAIDRSWIEAWRASLGAVPVSADRCDSRRRAPR